MGRFLASYLAGIIVIAGGWFGWTSPDRVAEAVSDSADLIVPSPSDDSHTETHRPRFDEITLP